MPHPSRSRRSVLYAVPYITAQRIEEIAHVRNWPPYDVLRYAIDALWLVYAAEQRRKPPQTTSSTRHISELSPRALRAIRKTPKSTTP